MIKRVVFCVLAVGIYWSSTSAFAQDQAPAPAHKEGQTWQFKVTETFLGISNSNAFDGIYELTVAGENITVAKVTDGQREPITARTGILGELVGKSQDDDPDFKFPLSAGQKWTYQYKHKATGAKKAIQRSVEVNVTGPEEVTTAAGTFKVLKVKKEDGTGRGNTWVTTHYWSSTTNSVVKSSYDTTDGGGQGVKREVELIKFSANP
jgi:hypothetical protein